MAIFLPTSFTEFLRQAVRNLYGRGDGSMWFISIYMTSYVTVTTQLSLKHNNGGGAHGLLVLLDGMRNKQ